MTQREKSYAQRIREERMGRPYGPLPAAHFRTDDAGEARMPTAHEVAQDVLRQMRAEREGAGAGRSGAQIARDAMLTGTTPRFDGQEPQGFRNAREAREAADAAIRARSMGRG